MKVGIYNPRVGTKSAGGTETFLRQVIKRCDETVVLFTGEGELLSEIDDLDLTVEQIPVRYKEDRATRLLTAHTPVLPAEIESISMFYNAFRTGAMDRLRECDVVSTHYYADNLLVSRFVDVPHVFRFAGIKGPSIRWRTMFLADDTDYYVANSASTADRLAELYDLEVDGIVYPGVDVTQFSPAERPTEMEFIVLFVGRLDEGKGIPDLIQAIGGTDMFLRIVGDGDRRSDYEMIANEALEADQYEFVGEIPHDQIQEEFRRADTFCLPSYHESFGLVVLEALACGVPTVTTEIDAIKEYVDHRENGLLFEPGDVERLESLMHELKESPSLRQRLSKNGRETSLEYSWEAQADRMTATYRRVLE